MSDKLEIIFKGNAIPMRSVNQPDNQFTLTPFLGFSGEHAGVGYLDESRFVEIQSSCKSATRTHLPIIKAWRAFQILCKIDKLIVGVPYLVWSVLGRIEKTSTLQPLLMEGVEAASLLEMVMSRYPSDEEIVDIATKCLLVGRKIDFDELYREIAVGLPSVIEVYYKLTRVIDSQRDALDCIKKVVQDTDALGVKNPF